MSAPDRLPETRLNIVVSDDTMGRLLRYGAQTGRSVADVVRQVLDEWLRGPPVRPACEHPTGRRINVRVPADNGDLVRSRLEREGHKTLSALIERLLCEFLAHRVVDSEPTLSLELKITQDDHAALLDATEARGISIEDYAIEALRSALSREQALRGRPLASNSNT